MQDMLSQFRLKLFDLTIFGLDHTKFGFAKHNLSHMVCKKGLRDWKYQRTREKTYFECKMSHFLTLNRTNKRWCPVTDVLETLLECFFRVDLWGNTCKDKAGVGRGLSVAARVTMPYTWHGLSPNSIRNSVESLQMKDHRKSVLFYSVHFKCILSYFQGLQL